MKDGLACRVKYECCASPVKLESVKRAVARGTNAIKAYIYIGAVSEGTLSPNYRTLFTGIISEWACQLGFRTCPRVKRGCFEKTLPE